MKKFQSTQPKRAATGSGGSSVVPARISIHAAQEGCDPKESCNDEAAKISIHAAQEGCDNQCALDYGITVIISIHAAQEGCDSAGLKLVINGTGFQSTQPKRAATFIVADAKVNPYISIHAAQEGCD